jgi:hypothetical protein
MNKLLYLQSLKSIKDSVPPDRRDDFDLQYGAREKDPAVSLALSLWFGYLGIDRFYIGGLGRASLTRGNVGNLHAPGNDTAETALCG